MGTLSFEALFRHTVACMLLGHMDKTNGLVLGGCSSAIWSFSAPPLFEKPTKADV